MAEINLQRKHNLGLAQARKLAFEWAEKVEQDFEMECTYEEGKTQDEVSFTRSGVNGTLVVTKDHFDLNAKLGMLVGMFKDRIESEIVKELDTLLAAKSGKKK